MPCWPDPYQAVLSWAHVGPGRPGPLAIYSGQAAIFCSANLHAGRTSAIGLFERCMPASRVSDVRGSGATA